jgi:hypothetical protein
MEIHKEPNECAFNLNKNGKDTCFEDYFIKELSHFATNIKKIFVKNIKDPFTTIKELKKVYNCDHDSCLLVQDDIINAIGHDKTQKQLQERFKPTGPYEGSDWFSNVDIDSVLKQISEKYKYKKFKHIPFQMRDFQLTNSELSKIDFVEEYNKGIRCFGVVFNTDKSSGSGQHWYSIFGDFSKEPFTIEYFNSSGESPQDEIKSWMSKTKHKMEKNLGKKVNDVVVSKIQHQRDNHSCGSYSIYYIVSRLEGISHMIFSQKRIPDEWMHKFRYSLFRKEK